jgi:hypothetical protein
VDDAWLALTVLSGPDGLDPLAAPVPLGAPDDVAVAGLRVAVEAGGETAGAALMAAGAVEAPPPPPTHHDEATDITQRYWHRTELSGPEADKLLWDWDRYRRRMAVAAQLFDVLVTATVAEPAPLARALTAEDYRWTVAWSLTGSPALSLPFGRSADGLPLAVQVVGRPWEDHVVVAAARTVEVARPQL